MHAEFLSNKPTALCLVWPSITTILHAVVLEVVCFYYRPKLQLELKQIFEVIKGKSCTKKTDNISFCFNAKPIGTGKIIAHNFLVQKLIYF